MHTWERPRTRLAFPYVITYDNRMGSIITATQARANLYTLLSEVNAHHDPVTITGKHGNAILISEQDWNAITVTLALHAVTGLVEDIAAGRAEPVDNTPLEW